MDSDTWIACIEVFEDFTQEKGCEFFLQDPRVYPGNEDYSTKIDETMCVCFRPSFPPFLLLLPRHCSYCASRVRTRSPRRRTTAPAFGSPPAHARTHTLAHGDTDTHSLPRSLSPSPTRTRATHALTVSAAACCCR